ncbi:thiopeptide-type bacteriocin biosynthesis protein [Flavobacterium chungbukense]|uniref:Thiopeptide-type bacteriocin biosynthesis domain-containing protein n=1 Tax=Flavobacterium chungbukense TaxID=877464 RepID=A0ABP7YM27_9FLAO|nr:thiopeptide-type bacteriocin biosynthesis protein [Flavobacterium chungbukense]MCC4919895.1 thiopeptide-type bacteriocin biosynthesis protein [Flavobacterium chungbukense]
MQRDFCLGSQWLYYKIYTGVKTADNILLEKIAPVITHLEAEKKIEKWFFIRYKDTDEHIRFRVLLNEITDLAFVINEFYLIFKPLMDDHLIWKIQTDTYQREIERYGIETMLFSEFLFWKDSAMILNYLDLKSSFSNKEMPLLFSFLAIDSFLNSFNLSISEKMLLMNDLQIAFKNEFEIDKVQKKKISTNYLSLYPALESLLENPNQNDFSDIFFIVNEKSIEIKETVSKILERIEIPLNDFLSSHIHMMINRQYTSKQRMYELVIYDHLYRYYKTLNYKKVKL